MSEIGNVPELEVLAVALARRLRDARGLAGSLADRCRGRGLHRVAVCDALTAVVHLAEPVEMRSAAQAAHRLGFDPAGFSERGASTCLACGASVDGRSITAEGVPSGWGSWLSRPYW